MDTSAIFTVPVKIDPAPDFTVKLINNSSEAYIGLVHPIRSTVSPENSSFTYNWHVPEGMSASSLTEPAISILPRYNSNEQMHDITLSVSNGVATVKETLSLRVYSYNPEAYELDLLTVKASGYQDGNSPENLFDNNFNTRWSVEGDEEYVIFELVSESTLSHFEIASYKGDERVAYFDIFASNDSENWELLLEGGKTCGFATYNQTFIVPVTNALKVYKYIKFTGHMNSINAWNSYTEFKAFGQAKTSYDPQEDTVFRVYPNPADQNVYIKSEEGARIRVIDITGSVVHEQISTGEISELNCNLKSAVYLVQITTTSNKTFTQKLLVR